MEQQKENELKRLFTQSRIVFWYDSEKNLKEDFDSLSIDGVEKIEINNNEFAIRYRVLKEDPNQNFLLYKQDAEPTIEDNWLADIQLYSCIFKADQTSIWLSQVGLENEYYQLVKNYASFFKSEERRQKLQKNLNRNNKSNKVVKLAMVSVLVNSEGTSLDRILNKLLEEKAKDRNDRIENVKKFGLDPFLWEELKQNYGFVLKVQSIDELYLELFRNIFNKALNLETDLNNEGFNFFNQWKENKNCENDFKLLSELSSTNLDIEKQLNDQNIEQLLDLDCFRLIDLYVLKYIADGLKNNSVIAEKILSYIQSRRQCSSWFKEYECEYAVIEAATKFNQLVAKVNFDASNFKEFVENYTKKDWFLIDKYYRQAIYNYTRNSKSKRLLQPLIEELDSKYKLVLQEQSVTSQKCMSASTSWPTKSLEVGIATQREFFNQNVLSKFTSVNSKNRLCVIISDALRYEIADELKERIDSENRYKAILEPMLSSLPSFTQLGMASLLPHTDIELKSDGNVIIDGKSSQGIPNRQKILEQQKTVLATACKVEDILQMKQDESRDYVQKYNVIYIYHNEIDHVGDDTASESGVFEAVNNTFDTIVKLIKKLNCANINNFIVTSDHGFLYQNNELEASDYVDCPFDIQKCLYKNRRFILGKDLYDTPSLKKYSSKDLVLKGDLDVVVPYGVKRLRNQGSGSKYVHGGASLQEVIIPILSVNKIRKDDVSKVHVAIYPPSKVISSAITNIKFVQEETISEKVKEITLVAGFYNQDNELISEQKTLTFNNQSSDSRDLEQKIEFRFNKEADNSRNQSIFFKVEEVIDGSSATKEYFNDTFTFRKSIATDFD